MKIKKLGKMLMGVVAFTGLLSLTSCDLFEKTDEETTENVSVANLSSYDSNYGIANCSFTHDELLTYALQNKDVSSIGQDCKLYLYTMCDSAFTKEYRNVVNSIYWNIEEYEENGDSYARSYKTYKSTSTTFYEGKLYYINYNANDSSMNNVDDVFNEFFNGEINNYLYYKEVDYDLFSFDTTDVYLEQMRDEIRSGMVDQEINPYFNVNTYNSELNHTIIFIPNQTFTLNVNTSGNEGYYDEIDYKYYGIEVVEYELKDILSPDFNVSTYWFYTNINSPYSNDYILSQIKAYDETDGDVSSRVELVSTNYNPSVVGLYDFNVRVSDLSGNVSNGEFKIKVYDIDKPVITGDTELRLKYYDDMPDVNTIINDYTDVSDYYDSVNNLTLTITKDVYSSYKGVVGGLLNTYDITFLYTDTSGNQSDSHNIKVYILDDIKPVITAPSTIEISNQSLISLDEIKSKVSVNDSYCGEIDYAILGYEDYSLSYKAIGEYELTISATDDYNNTSTHIIKLIVKDTKAPSLFVSSDFVIVVPKGDILTNDLILQYLVSVNEIESANVDYMECDYVDEVGEYEVCVYMLDNTIYKASIRVDGYSNDSSNGNWFTNAWNNVCNWFKGIGDWFKGIFNWVKGLFVKEETDDSIIDDETELNPENDVVPESVLMSEEEYIIDDEFVVWEYPDFDCGNEPATMPDDSIILG